MRNQRVATSFLTYAQTKLLQKAQTIYQSLTDNPAFPDPTPNLAALNVAIAAYAFTLSAPPSKANTQLKKQNRAALIAVLNQLAMYIQVTGNGNAAIYETSGYSLTKLPQPVGILSKPVNFKVRPAYTGAVKLSLTKIDGADSYCFEYTSAPLTEESTWVSIQSSKASTIISNLNRGGQYVFRVTGIGSNPTCVYSDEITSYVL